MTDPAATSRQRVVVLAGPSGSGKSRLASRLHAAHGWPIFRLDDFYRDEDDPSMPRSEGLGIIDWDHPDSWNGDRAVASLCELVDTGRTDTPVYDISTSRAVGHHEVTAAPADLVIAEGIFAAEVVDRLRGLRRAAQRLVRAPPARRSPSCAGSPATSRSAASRRSPWCAAAWP